MGFAGCGTPRNELSDPAALALPPSQVPRFTASGRIRIESGRGDIEGRIALRVDPPWRVWLEVRADAVFGLVGERVVVAAPGDGYVLTYEERADRLERVAFASSWGPELAPGAELARVLEIATARLPWPREAPPPAPVLDGDRWAIDLEPAGSKGRLRVAAGPLLLRSLEWIRPGEDPLRLEYGDPIACGTDWLPSRVQARGGDLKIDLELDRVEPRDAFTDADFEVDGTPTGGGG